MTPERYQQLMDDEDPLSDEEIAEGWHFCYDWDGLLVGPGMEETGCCSCELPSPVNEDK